MRVGAVQDNSWAPAAILTAVALAVTDLNVPHDLSC